MKVGAEQNSNVASITFRFLFWVKWEKVSCRFKKKRISVIKRSLFGDGEVESSIYQNYKMHTFVNCETIYYDHKDWGFLIENTLSEGTTTEVIYNDLTHM